MNQPTIELLAGQPFTLGFQAFLRGSGGKVPAVYNSTDTLVCSILRERQTSPVAVPAISWLTTNPVTGESQSGFAQGQVVAQCTASQAVVLQPLTPYTIMIWRVIQGDSLDPDPIVRRQISIKPLAF
jgi:hypothetical protein